MTTLEKIPETNAVHMAKTADGHTPHFHEIVFAVDPVLAAHGTAWLVVISRTEAVHAFLGIRRPISACFHSPRAAHQAARAMESPMYWAGRGAVATVTGVE